MSYSMKSTLNKNTSIIFQELATFVYFKYLNWERGQTENFAETNTIYEQDRLRLLNNIHLGKASIVFILDTCKIKNKWII